MIGAPGILGGGSVLYGKVKPEMNGFGQGPLLPEYDDTTMDEEIEDDAIENLGIPYVDRRFYFPESWIWSTAITE